MSNNNEKLIKNEKYDIRLIRSKRRSVSIEINKNCQIIARAPMRLAEDEILSFIKEKEVWIDKALAKAKSKQENLEKQPELFSKDMRELTLKARKEIPVLVKEYAEMMGVTYGKITIRSQKSRWGSCSSKGNLNFNCLLMLTPDDVVRYVVVHELSHRIHMNHSVDFWREVEKILPDYKKRRKWLKENGNEIIERVHENE